ncbi:ABC transporter permease [Isobaculum melis]|uniref:ABC-type multidrug transport system, permease component n=1 Tax=Isobaculum melis TaxID=142588 RepID=A0A1H9QR15_9LACT|nr:ABC transporter permease [Isobaculum melis]SER62888.1 ABC-type multidrug transport system, permease component [Isobaculum melis]
MNTLIIAWTEIKLTIREKSNIIYMLALPIFLITVLGVALGSGFSETVKIDDMKIGYQVTEEALEQPFEMFIKEVETDAFAFEEITSASEGEEAVKNGDLTAIVEVDKEGMHLSYQDQLGEFSKAVIEGYMEGFSGELQLIQTLYQVAPEKMATYQSASKETTNQITTAGVAGKETESSIQYYSIAVITMMMAYGMLYGAQILASEKRSHTLNRILMTPVTRGQLFTGKLLGCITIQSVFIALTMLYSYLAFQMDWGSYWLIVFGLFTLEMICAIAIGLFADGITGGKLKGLPGILSIVITIFSALGGAYFPIPDSNVWKNISPIGYLSTVMKQVVYQNKLDVLLLPIIVLVLISVGCILGYSVLTRKKEVI